MHCYAHAYFDFVLTISIKKTEVLGQNVRNILVIKIGKSTLNAVDEFTYRGSIISSSLSLDPELNRLPQPWLVSL